MMALALVLLSVVALAALVAAGFAFKVAADVALVALARPPADEPETGQGVALMLSTGQATCDVCGHEWPALFPAGQAQILCPACKQLTDAPS